MSRTRSVWDLPNANGSWRAIRPAPIVSNNSCKGGPTCFSARAWRESSGISDTYLCRVRSTTSTTHLFPSSARNGRPPPSGSANVITSRCSATRRYPTAIRNWLTFLRNCIQPCARRRPPTPLSATSDRDPTDGYDDSMTGPIVECVPNFSEGRDAGKVRAIATAIGSVEGIVVLDVTLDPDHHRSVITFAGRPDSVGEAALRGVAQAVESIDLTRQSGVHPRIGAADVVPFVPVQSITLRECADLA